MKIAYLILAHNLPDQVERTVKRLNTKDNLFIIHYDQKSSKKEYLQLHKALKSFNNVIFTKRTKVTWGHYNTIEATLLMIKELIKSRREFDYMVLLSGQSYPIKPNRYISKFLKKNNGKIFMNNWLIKKRSKQYLHKRIEKWHFFFDKRIYSFPPSWLNIKRRFPKGFMPYKGNEWFALPKEAVIYIHNFVMKNKKFSEFFRYSLLSDEIFFQTILMNSRFKQDVVNSSLHFIIWPGPKTLSSSDFDDIKASNMLYARKFNSKLDANILNLIDNHILDSPHIKKIDSSMIAESSPEKSRKKLPGTFWGITTFFNPAGYKNKYKNYRIFRENSKRQGLKLLSVELAFNKPFELKKQDADILIQLRGNEKNILWQKERLLNIGLKKLPKNCDKIAWLDCDIIFKDDNWIKNTSSLLEHYKVIQPFSYAIKLDKKGTIKNNKEVSFAYIVAGEHVQKRLFLQTGLAWAARKEIFDKHGFYDRMIIGGADNFMANAFYHGKNITNSRFTQHQNKWIKDIHKKVKKSVYFSPGTVLHLWHGSKHNRLYEGRASTLYKYNFDPENDVHINSKGLLELSAKKSLNREIRDYFKLRREEGGKPFRRIYLKYHIRDKRRRIKRSAKIHYAMLLGSIGRFMVKNTPSAYRSLKRHFPDIIIDHNAL